MHLLEYKVFTVCLMSVFSASVRLVHSTRTGGWTRGSSDTWDSRGGCTVRFFFSRCRFGYVFHNGISSRTIKLFFFRPVLFLVQATLIETHSNKFYFWGVRNKIVLPLDLRNYYWVPHLKYQANIMIRCKQSQVNANRSIFVVIVC